MRTVRLIAVLAVIALAVLAGVVILSARLEPTEAELRERAGLTGKQELRVGVIDDRPGLSHWNEEAGQFEGFEIDLAYRIAAELGFRRSDVTFHRTDSEKRASMQAGSETVDLVIASFSITPAREKKDIVSFSKPYLRTWQSVVTREDWEGDDLQSYQELKGRKVCTIGTSTSAGALEEAGLRDEIIRKRKIKDCVDGLRGGEFDAMTTDAVIMAGWVHKYRDELRHHDIADEKIEEYGVNTGGKEALRTLVNLALYRMLQDPQNGGWLEAYDANLRPLQAANQPQTIAQDEQPHLDRPRVRQLPWDTWAE